MYLLIRGKTFVAVHEEIYPRFFGLPNALRPLIVRWMFSDYTWGTSLENPP